MERARYSAAQLEELTRINSEDLLGALGLGEVRRGRRLLMRLCRPPAQRLARQVLAYDALAGSAGLQVGAAWALGQFVRDVAVEGQERIPAAGPLLVVANHPGLYDTIALFAAIPRADLRVIAADRPFLRALPHTYRRILAVPDTAGRTGLIRAATRQLRSGGALLTFPGGRIEPDPAVMPGAVAALERWSASIGVFGRLVEGLTVVPAVVSGVLSAAALRNPVAHMRGPEHHHLLAATLQVLLPFLQRTVVRVSFGRPLCAAALPGDALAVAAVDECRRLIERCAAGAAS